MFNGKHVLITGASSGLGASLALEFAARGARLSLLARNTERLNAVAAQVRAANPRARAEVYSVDVRSPDAVASVVADANTRLGPVDMLINNAGVLREGHFEKLPLETFREVLDVDFFGPLHLIKAALPQLKETKGRIVNVASVAGLTGVFGYAPYCSAKHALIGLTETLRYELEPQGVKVQLACPPEFDSPMVDDLESYRTPENRAHTLTIPKMPMSTVVADIVRGIERGGYLITPGLRTRLAVWGMRHFPGVSYRVAKVRIERARREGRA